MFHSLLIESCLVVDSIDYRATNHICNSLQGFQQMRKLNEEAM